VLLTTFVSAQQKAQTVTISGNLDAITANGTIIVDGQTYQLANGAALPSSALLGLNVTITGQVDPTTQTVIVISITITSSEATPEATPEVTATPSPEQTPDPEATPEATDQPDDDDGDIIIVIEGPVQSINVNIITIYNINIELDDDDPLLTVIQIGDVIRVEGNLTEGDNNTIIIVVVNIIFVNVEVVVQDGQVWRDDGNCGNPPPPWAPAHGWRRRCERSGGGGSGGRGNDGSGSKS
jgi:hypothetical protein